MVFFICDACQETLKRNKVDAHCRRCRNCWVLSCVDCGKRFEGDDYLSHTTCMSEAEKYQGALYRAPSSKPGQKADPQQRWCAAMRSALVKARADGGSASSEAAATLEQLVGCSSVPRKRTKFGNFLKNSMRLVDAALVTEVFDLIHAANAELNAPSPSPAPAPSKGSVEIPAKSAANTKKRPREVVEQAEPSKKSKAATWRKAARRALKSAEGNTLTIKMLFSVVRDSIDEEMDQAKLKRRLKKSAKFELDGKNVRLAIRAV